MLVKGIEVGNNDCLPALGVGRGWNGSLTGQQVIGGSLRFGREPKIASVLLAVNEDALRKFCWSVLN